MKVVRNAGKHAYRTDEGITWCSLCRFTEGALEGHQCSGVKGILGRPVQDLTGRDDATTSRLGERLDTPVAGVPCHPAAPRPVKKRHAISPALDLAGVSDDLTIQSVGILFGLRKPPRPGETATQAGDRERAEELEQQPEQVARHEQPHIPALTPTIKSRPVRLFNRDAIHWQHIGDRFVVGLKDDTLIVLDPQENGWRVLVMGEQSYRIAARSLDLGYAQGAAEHLIRTSGTVSLADREAPWRQLPASAGQRGKLWHMGVRVPAGATRGQAADLITETSAAERLARFDARGTRARFDARGTHSASATTSTTNARSSS